MDQLVQCPVCTLFLHNGMSLESHLDTHPKDQVIKALCSLSANRSNFGSRASTPMHSERSYRSRSRTPATDDKGSDRWNGGHGSESDKSWHRSFNKTPRPSNTRSATPASVNNIYEPSKTPTSLCNPNVFTHTSRLEKDPPQYPGNALINYDTYNYNREQKEEKEIKYSRSEEYHSLQNSPGGAYIYNMQPPAQPCVKVPLLSNTSKRSDIVNVTDTSKQEFLKILPKPSNIALVKTNVGYLPPGVVMTSDTMYNQKNSNNLIIGTSLPTAPTMVQQSRAISAPLSTNQFSQLTSSSFAPNTTVVTQNSQIVYRGMVANIEGKSLMPGIPTVLGTHENITNVAQSTSMYQNVMVLDQYGNTTSCMYATPQLLPKPPTPMYSQTSNTATDKNTLDSNKTLIIEVSPMKQPTSIACEPSASIPAVTAKATITEITRSRDRIEKYDVPLESPASNKGLKILSNIKVEVPVQHHKSLLNKVVDLTGPIERDYPKRDESPERILPDIEIHDDKYNETPNVVCDNVATNTFSVIKNIGNPSSHKDSKNSNNQSDKNHDNESSNSFPVPDLICNEKPSISPCSELSDNGDNAVNITSILGDTVASPAPMLANIQPKQEPLTVEPVIPVVKTHRNNPLRLNNIFVKKSKKILQIKNAKQSSDNNPNLCENSAGPSRTSKSPKSVTIFQEIKEVKTKTQDQDIKQYHRSSKLITVSIDKINDEDHEFDADTEEQSMDIELDPAPGSYHPSNEYSGIDLTQVKEEVNNSNDFSNEADRQFNDIESIRPVNVQYGSISDDFDDDSNNRELLDLETAKTKHFVNMMNENYFGDNIYADYFTADRVESFDAVRDGGFGKEAQIWGEPSQKESEFVLPNFIHDNYKIADSGGDGYLGATDSKADVLSDSRSDADAPLNICADEKMPPRGELSGQESNGDMEASWPGMYQEVTPAEPYDLMARESWVSDASDVDSNDKQDNIGVQFTCGACGLQLAHAHELRRHVLAAHPPAGSSRAPPALPPALPASPALPLYSTKLIKTEEKADFIAAGMQLLQDSKAAIASTMLEVYDVINETKAITPKIEGTAIVKQEVKRKRRDYVCATCKVDQLTEARFQAHLQLHPLECLSCGKCFNRRANLQLHIKMHLGIKNYKCGVCDKRFVTRQKLLEHDNVHTGRAPIKCTLCDRAFRRYSNMVQHRDRNHFHKKPKVRDYVCHCGEVYHSRAKLRWHKETHDGKPKACQYCSDKFVHMSSLTRHVRRMHNAYFMREDLKKNENVPCPICKQIYLRSNLKTHLRTHSGKRPYLCVICNKSFTTQWNLKLHRWTHMSRSSKPYKCGLCKGAFIRQTEYISHMNSHKSVRPYTCNYCGCQFIRKYNCQRHVKEHEMMKKYVCKVPDCGKTFHRSYYLSEHMKVHSGARPFSCNICGKTSSNKSNHNKHVKIHHAREPVATEA